MGNSDRNQVWYPICKQHLPGNSHISVDVADEAVVIGYPIGFYDKVNFYPIVKRGNIASRWEASFNGKPYFLIDAKLFPGSSGSIVVSKPQQFTVVNGQLMITEEKLFAFLGIYSGQLYQTEIPIEFDDMTIVRRKKINLGIVWYSYLIDEIIDNGIQLPNN